MFLPGWNISISYPFGPLRNLRKTAGVQENLNELSEQDFLRRHRNVFWSSRPRCPSSSNNCVMFRTTAPFHHQTHLSWLQTCTLPAANNSAVPRALQYLCSGFTLYIGRGPVFIFWPVMGKPVLSHPLPHDRPCPLDNFPLLYDFSNIIASPCYSAIRSAEATSWDFPSSFKKLIPLIKMK